MPTSSTPPSGAHLSFVLQEVPELYTRKAKKSRMRPSLPTHNEDSELSRDDQSLPAWARKSSLNLLIPQQYEAAHDSRPADEARIPFTARVKMLLQLDHIPLWHNLLASFFSWLLLAGYIVLPVTFASIRKSQNVSDGAGNAAGDLVLKVVDNVPILWIGAIFCLIGSSGMLWLSWLWKNNYEWLLTRIITPSLLHATVGLVNTFVNIYTVQHGSWSVTAVITATVTGSCTVLMAILFFFYDILLLAEVKKIHEKKMIAEDHAGYEALKKTTI